MICPKKSTTKADHVQGAAEEATASVPATKPEMAEMVKEQLAGFAATAGAKDRAEAAKEKLAPVAASAKDHVVTAKAGFLDTVLPEVTEKLATLATASLSAGAGLAAKAAERAEGLAEELPALKERVVEKASAASVPAVATLIQAAEPVKTTGKQAKRAAAKATGKTTKKKRKGTVVLFLAGLGAAAVGAYVYATSRNPQSDPWSTPAPSRGTGREAALADHASAMAASIASPGDNDSAAEDLRELADQDGTGGDAVDGGAPTAGDGDAQADRVEPDADTDGPAPEAAPGSAEDDAAYVLGEDFAAHTGEAHVVELTEAAPDVVTDATQDGATELTLDDQASDLPATAASGFAHTSAPEFFADGGSPVPAGAVLPLADGSAPEGYPVKGNADSGLYHEPGGRWYDATIAEFWFATAEDAEAAGFTKAGRPRSE